MLRQQRKQKTFFSFFLRFSWTPQAPKNVSAISPSSHAGFMFMFMFTTPAASSMPEDHDSLTISLSPLSLSLFPSAKNYESVKA
jgi:hypothetical protein